MESTIEKINDIVVLTVQFEALDAKTAKEIRQEFDAVTEAGIQVLLDLEKVQFVDSAGLGAIVSWLKQLRSIHGDLMICNVNKAVRALFELVRMRKLVDIHDDRNQALGISDPDAPN